MPKTESIPTVSGRKELTSELTKPRQFVPQHGRGRLNSGGTVGHRGGSGRPKDQVKAFWASVLNGKASRREVRKILENSDHPAFVSLYGKIAVYVAGVPGRDQEIDEDDSPLVILNI